MIFSQEKRFRLKQVFTAATLCGLTAASVLTGEASTPLSFLACVTAGFLGAQRDRAKTLEFCKKGTSPIGKDHPALPEVKELSEAAGIPMPKVMISISPYVPTSVHENTLYLDHYRLFQHHNPPTYEELRGTIAHEIGHLLLGSTTHTPTGLMRGAWSDVELRQERPEDWVFPPPLAGLLQSRVAERTGRSALETSPFGCGTD